VFFTQPLTQTLIGEGGMFLSTVDKCPADTVKIFGVFL
jgi:hypothetical protein